MSVLKAWLGVALALAEFAALPHCEGKVKSAVPSVCSFVQFKTRSSLSSVVGWVEVF